MRGSFFLSVPFVPGRLAFAMWLRGVRIPGVAAGFGGTVVDSLHPTPTASARDVALPLEALEALDVLDARLRATGLPERTPAVEARVDTSDGWTAHRLCVAWNDRPPVHLFVEAAAAGCTGPDAPAVEMLFRYLKTLGRSGADR